MGTRRTRKSKAKGEEKVREPFSSFIPHLGEEWKPLIAYQNSIREFKAGEKIFSEGEEVQGMFCVNSGKVKVFSSDSPDGEHIVRLAGNGDLVGIRGIGPELIFPVSATALTDCQMSFLPINVFVSLLRTNNNFCYYFMNLLASELRKSERYMRIMARMEMKERVALAIIRNLEAYGYHADDKHVLAYTLSRKDYSSMAGTTYETVIRMLSELEKKKLIRLERKAIRILNEAELRKLIVT